MSISAVSTMGSGSYSVSVTEQVKELQNQIKKLQVQVSETQQSDDSAEVKEKRLQLLQMQIEQLQIQIEKLQNQKQEEAGASESAVKTAVESADDSQQLALNSTGLMDYLI